MRIAYITAGAAGMICGTCLHDNTLAAALIRKGHQVALVPTYTPIRTDEEDVSLHRVFFGGINVYLQQKSALFRATPWVLDRLLDSPSLLNRLAGMSSATNARELGELTVSILRGDDGNQRKELEKLAKWLKEEYKPDLVQLTNSMFAGFASTLKRELGVPVLCSLAGEDLFLEDLAEPYRTQAFACLAEKSQNVDGFISSTEYYAHYMSGYLKMPAEKIHVVPLGIKVTDAPTPRTVERRADAPFVVGYLARISPEKGLHLLVDGFHRLAGKVGKEKVLLRAAGWIGKKDQPYLKSIRTQMREWNLEERFEYAGELDRIQKWEFLSGIDVLCVPTIYKDPKGLFALEAMAAGVPVVLPDHGGFPEMMKATGGGILIEPQSADAVEAGLHRLMLDADLRSSLGSVGRESVHRCYNDEVMAEAMLRVYGQYKATGVHG